SLSCKTHTVESSIGEFAIYGPGCFGLLVLRCPIDSRGMPEARNRPARLIESGSNRRVRIANKIRDRSRTRIADRRNKEQRACRRSLSRLAMFLYRDGV